MWTEGNGNLQITAGISTITFNGLGATYDLNGNLKTYNGWTYIYDAQNRLTTVKQGTTTVAQYWYDGLNRQITRNVNGAITFHVWDGWNLIEERDTGNAIQNIYLYAGDQIIENVTTKRFFFQDSLGNTTHLSDEAGYLLERYTYSAFGLPTFYTPGGTVTPGNISTKGTRHLFQGQLWTQETGLNDYRNRVEHPIMGVFLQPDPIGFKGDAANLYRFCTNNAVNRIDPDGLIVVDDRWSRLMHWQGHSQYSFNAIAEAYRNWQPAGMSGGLNINWHGLVGLNNAARIDSATRTGPSVDWRDTGDDNISQPYVYSDKGARLPARTFTEINVVGESYKGKLIGLYVNHKVDVKYASTAGPNTRKWARDVEPAHRNELRAWGLDSGRDIARGIASKYRNDPQRAVNEANTVLKNELRKQAEQSHLYHDYPKPIGIGDHISKYPYEW